MAGLKGITMNIAPEAEPNIYAEDDAAIWQSILGEDGVTTIGSKCESQVISNNKVRVKDGVVIVGGHVGRIPYGDYVDCEIANGRTGVNRNDIIMAKFVTTGTGGIDVMTCEVKQGVAGTVATDPAMTQNDLYAAGKIREMPLYRVKIEELSIVKVEKMFEEILTIPELRAAVDDLNNELKAPNKILWEGAMYMHDKQEIVLSEPVSEQKMGISLEFSYRNLDGTIEDSNWQTFTIPKASINDHEGQGRYLLMGANNTAMQLGYKYLYMSNQKIKGHAVNDDVITSQSGTKYDNTRYILRRVIGI